MKERTKIMVFGTFDVLHKGHFNFFKQAKKLAKNSWLIVSVARDINVKRIKGKKPLYSEVVRKKRISTLKYVDKVVLGGIKNYINHILKEAPKIIALGYDQHEYTKDLQKKLLNGGLKVQVVKLKAYKPKVYKSSLILKAKKV